jgi:hypothetical protein
MFVLIGKIELYFTIYIAFFSLKKSRNSPNLMDFCPFSGESFGAGQNQLGLEIGLGLKGGSSNLFGVPPLANIWSS